jgi:hypothetical protein
VAVPFSSVPALSEPVLVHDVRPGLEDVSLRQLIESCGINCRFMKTPDLRTELDRASDHSLCIMASANTIHDWSQESAEPVATTLGRLLQKASLLFLYGFESEMPSTSVAVTLTNGAITAVRSFTRRDLRYDVSSLHPEITKEFSGLSFAGVRNSTDCAFVCEANLSGIAPLVSIEGMPLWLLAERNGCKVFLLACSVIADIHEQVDNNLDVTKYFSRLLPAMMFLKSAFKGRCWQSKSRFANFIIDDPTLKPSYGYLNYRELVSRMDESDFASTIAFIPWNHRRTDNEVAQLFRQRPDRLSLCVHGCDHTTAEFSARDQGVLNCRVQLATARMDSLQHDTGISYSKTMVFPQGRFSIAALTALKANNYLAAVNSSASLSCPGTTGSLSLQDFLGPAITSYGGFPVFVRRYPGGTEQFAFDLFSGKPLLTVEHHGYLKDGGARLTEFISRLNSFKDLQWCSLDEIMMRSYLEREISREAVACRVYTNRSLIKNDAEHDRMFIITKFEPGEIPVRNVLVNGESAEFSVHDDVLQFTMNIPALSHIVVKIVYRNELPRVQPAQGLATRTQVWTRRMLSEFRANVLCRGDALVSSARSLQSRLAGRIATHWINPDDLSCQ